MELKVLEPWDAVQSHGKLEQMIEQLDAYVKEMKDFVNERERLGEYDASAAAIFELSKATLRVMELQLVALQAIIASRLEG